MRLDDDDFLDVWNECHGRCKVIVWCAVAWIVALGIAAWGIHKYWVGG